MSVLTCAFLVALAAQPLALALLRRADALDRPNERSSHRSPTLRGGGLAVAVAILAAVGLAPGAGHGREGAVGAAGVVLVGLAALGLFEDIVGVSPRRRLAAQCLVAVAAALIGAAEGAAVAVAVALAVAVVVYANAFNFMDGVNGISGAHAVLGGLVYAEIGATWDAPGVPLVALAVAGGALGFLPYNVPTARVFLGDCGSYALGGLLGLLAVSCLAAGAPPLLCLGPLSVYLADTGWTLWRRHRRGASLTVAHREHAYQRIADAGGHPAAALGTLAVTMAATAICWAAGTSLVGNLAAGALVGLLLLGYLCAGRLLAAAAPGTARPRSGAVRST